MKNESYKKIIVVTMFAIAMAFLETVVVIYLRRLYYPQGFNFPLSALIDPNTLTIEWIREFFTIVMLACIGILAGKKFYDRFAYFLYAFAIWDIFYYIWLKIILNWPLSLFEWDLLFLIPWPWISPVLAPLISSLTMILLTLCILHCQDKYQRVKLTLTEWFLLIIGSLMILYTFLIDYGKLIFQNNFASHFFILATNQEFQNLVASYVPTYYNWFLFSIGEIIIFTGIFMVWKRDKR